MKKKFGQIRNKPKDRMIYRSLDLNLDRGTPAGEEQPNLQIATHHSSVSSVSSAYNKRKGSRLEPNMVPTAEHLLLKKVSAAEAPLARSKAYH